MKKRLTGFALFLAIATQSTAIALEKLEENEHASSYHEVAMEKIDLNSASIAQLTTLPGVGSAKAKAIVQYREEVGPFLEIEQITQVKGIGNKMLAKIQQHIEVK